MIEGHSQQIPWIFNMNIVQGTRKSNEIEKNYSLWPRYCSNSMSMTSPNRNTSEHIVILLFPNSNSVVLKLNIDLSVARRITWLKLKFYITRQKMLNLWRATEYPVSSPLQRYKLIYDRKLILISEISLDSNGSTENSFVST